MTQPPVPKMCYPTSPTVLCTLPGTPFQARLFLLESESGLHTLKPWFVTRSMKEHIRKRPYMEVDVETCVGESFEVSTIPYPPLVER